MTSCPRYSRTSCQLECSLDQAISEVGCLPWSVSSGYKYTKVLWTFFEHFSPQLIRIPWASQIYFCCRYLPQRPDNYSRTCNLKEMPLFLAAMRSISASDCGCLPDCQFTDFYYSVSTNKFMWEGTVSRSLLIHIVWARIHRSSMIRLAILWPQKYDLRILFYSHFFSRECDSRNLNIDPLCTLGGGPLPKLWLDGVGCPQITCHDIAFSKDILSLFSFRWPEHTAFFKVVPVWVITSAHSVRPGGP